MSAHSTSPGHTQDGHTQYAPTADVRPFTASPPFTGTRPFTEFRAFRSHRHEGSAAGAPRCGCRTSAILERRAANAPHSATAAVPAAPAVPAVPAAPALPADSATAKDGADAASRADATGAADPFAARYGCPLPQKMRSAASGMSWAEFTATFAPACGPLQLRGFTEHRANPASKSISITLQVCGETRTVRAAGTGIISAMTAIVYEVGFPVEINSFHQQRAGTRTATFLECSRGYHRRWAMGTGSTPAESIVAAFIAAANLLNGEDGAATGRQHTRQHTIAGAA